MRKCMVAGVLAWYHGVFQHEGVPMCLVEYENGRLKLVAPDCVQFTERPDSKLDLNDLMWDLITEVRQIKERL